MKQHKLRTLLALFGIVWGTAAVVILVAIGNGFYQVNKKGLESITQNTLYIMPESTSKPYRGLGLHRPIHIRTRDLEQLHKQVPNLKAVSPYLSTNAKITYKHKQLHNELLGVSPGYLSQGMRVAKGGRFINANDLKHKAFTVFLGYKIAESLFDDINPINKTIFINSVPMTVIGVSSTDAEGTMLNNQSAANTVYINYNTFQVLTGEQNLHFFLVTPEKNANREQVIQSIRNYFANQFHFDPQDKTALNIPDTNEFSSFITWFFYGIQLFLGFCGLLTLAVGGIGIANTLFLIVSERTPEIGLRIALGARDYHILLQVLFESLLLVFIGGAIGLLVASGVISLLNVMHLPNGFGKPSIDLANFCITFIILLFIALAAGYFPAKKAAKLQPVEALAF